MVFFDGFVNFDGVLHLSTVNALRAMLGRLGSDFIMGCRVVVSTYLFYDISFYDAEISSGLTYIFFMTYDARWHSGTYFLTFIKRSIFYGTYV